MTPFLLDYLNVSETVKERAEEKCKRGVALCKRAKKLMELSDTCDGICGLEKDI